VVVTVQTHINGSLLKESNAEAFRILHSETSLALQEVPTFPSFTIIALIRKIYSGKHMCIPDFIFRNASVMAGGLHHTFLLVVKSKNAFYHVFDCIYGLPTVFEPPLPINSLPNPHHFSHHPLPPSPPLLPSTTMVFHRWPFSLKTFKVCMNGQ